MQFKPFPKKRKHRENYQKWVKKKNISLIQGAQIDNEVWDVREAEERKKTSYESSMT